VEVFSTAEFDKDFKKADKEATNRIKDIVLELKTSKYVGKRLKHAKDSYSIRINNKRLVYKVENDKVILLFFKSRENVYDYLRSQ
jgi:mRNA-degrading endonuclease RelE of RelBE toxin-antitoxin system